MHSPILARRPLHRPVPRRLVALCLLSAAAPSSSLSATSLMSAPAPADRTFAINVRFDVLPSRESEFLEVMRNNVRRTMETEPNALQFALGRDVDDPRAYYLHEEYRTRSDHAGTHRGTDHSKACMDFFDSKPFAEPHVADEFLLCHPGPEGKVANVDAVCLNVELCIDPDVREEFLAVIRQNKAGSDREPLCLQYSWGESVDEPNTFHFHEQYVGEEGVAAHNAAPHFKVWEEFASRGSPFARPPVVQKYRILLD